MKVLPASLFTALLTGLCLFSFAQTRPAVIQGKVLMDNKSAAEASTILLLRANDSTIVNSTLADRKGGFEFDNVMPNTYLLLASNIGCTKVYSNPYIVSPGRNLNAETLVLSYLNNQLQEVKVVARKSYVDVRPGKIVLSIPNSIIADGNSAYEILRQAPGVHVNTNESLSIIGRQPALITIDGKPTNLTGDDLVNLLRGMPSSTIQQIEMISSASAKYDASGGGIINIVLKKGKNVGTNGTFTIGGGYGKYAKGNTGIVFNNRTTKLNVFGNYSYENFKTGRSIETDRNITYDDILSNYNVDYKNTQKTYNHNFKVGADYNLTPTQSIGFFVSGIVRENNFKKDNTLNIHNRAHLDSIIVAQSALDRGSSYYNYNVNYNGKLDTSGKNLSADLTYSTYNRHSDEYITNNFYHPDLSTYRDILQLDNLSPSHIHIWTAKVDYINPLSKKSRLEAGVKYNRTNSDNILIFGELVDGTYQPDPYFSNNFLYTETVSAGYLNYVNKIGKVDITAGIRGENTDSKGVSMGIVQQTVSTAKKDYFNLFPQATLSYTYNKKNVFSLSYNRGIHRPGYDEINPFLYYTDLYDYRAGNPRLRPEYTTAIQLSHTYNDTFVSTLYYNVTTDAYDFPVYYQNDSTKINVTISKNFGRIFVWGATFYAPVQFTSWWNSNFNMDASYLRYTAYAVNGNFNKGSQDIILSTTQAFTVTSTLAAEVTARYESPTLYGINELKQSYAVNAGISKQLFEKRATVKLSINDIFNSDRTRNHAIYQNIDLSEINKRETRIVRLNFTYRFGKSTVKSASRHTAGNEDERRRLGN